jgi:hypothetical protein
MNLLEWREPPKRHEELLIWKAFVKTTQEDVWPIVARWIKKYGNPYDTEDSLYIEAVHYLIHK